MTPGEDVNPSPIRVRLDLVPRVQSAGIAVGDEEKILAPLVAANIEANGRSFMEIFGF